MMDGRDDRRAMNQPEHRQPIGARLALIMFGLSVGLVLMALQLWLLTLAFDLFQSGVRFQTAVIAGISGLVFIGGLAMLWLLDRNPPIGT